LKGKGEGRKRDVDRESQNLARLLGESAKDRAEGWLRKALSDLRIPVEKPPRQGGTARLGHVEKVASGFGKGEKRGR